MSYLKKKPTLPEPPKLHKEHPKKNNLEEIIGIIKEEPFEKPKWDGCSDQIKFAYHVMIGTTSHCSVKKMIEQMRQKLNEWEGH